MDKTTAIQNSSKLPTRTHQSCSPETIQYGKQIYHCIVHKM